MKRNYKWDFFIAIALALAAICFLPRDAVKDITGDLITFFSIQSAVILPAMIFTAGILKPDGLELEDARRYQKALKRQMIFWVALLGLDFVAVVSIIAGKALNWTLALPLSAPHRPLDFGWVLPLILYFTGSLAIFRMIPFVRGVLSLLDLNGEMTEKAITRRNQVEVAEKKSNADFTPLALPDGYGEIIPPSKTD